MLTLNSFIRSNLNTKRDQLDIIISNTRVPTFTVDRVINSTWFTKSPYSYIVDRVTEQVNDSTVTGCMVHTESLHVTELVHTESMHIIIVDRVRNRNGSQLIKSLDRVNFKELFHTKSPYIY